MPNLVRVLMLGLLLAAEILIPAAAQTSRPAAADTSRTLALIGGTLIDGSGATPIRNGVVLIRGERIEKIGTVDSLPVPNGYDRISAEDMTVLPGLWDMHVHLVFVGHTSLEQWLRNYGSQLEKVVMPAAAEQLLLAGVTSTRDLAAPMEVFSVKKRIDSGEIPGATGIIRPCAASAVRASRFGVLAVSRGVM